jgi:hypothetical protein
LISQRIIILLRRRTLNKHHFIIAAVIALMAGFVGGTMSDKLLKAAQTSPEQEELTRVIVATEIHLVDEQGRERWILKLSKDGEPAMTFINRSGWAPMALGLNKAGLPYYNMVLEPHKGGGASFALLDSEMRSRARLGLREDGEPYLSLMDPNGQVRANLGSIDFRNPLTGRTEKRSSSSLMLFSENGRILFSAPGLSLMPARTFESAEKGWPFD